MCLWMGRIPGNLHLCRCRALLSSQLHTASPPHSIIDHAANPAGPFSSATTRWAQNQLPERPSRSFTSVRPRLSLSGLSGLYLAPSRSLSLSLVFFPISLSLLGVGPPDCLWRCLHVLGDCTRSASHVVSSGVNKANRSAPRYNLRPKPHSRMSSHNDQHIPNCSL